VTQAAPLVVDNPAGGYRFLSAEGRPFSHGVVASGGFDLVHATFARPIPLEAGIEAAVRHVAAAARPVQSIAGFELRSPNPMSQAEFDAFNRGYVAILHCVGIEVEGLIPSARTNVAPIIGAVDRPSVFGFTYAVPAPNAPPAFLMAGVPEEVEGDARAMRRNITEILASRAAALSCRLTDSTAVQVYAAGALDPDAIADVATELGDAAIHGLRWFPSLPPIEGLKYEIDARAARTERVIGA
jgi:hypothetical protein